MRAPTWLQSRECLVHAGLRPAPRRRAPPRTRVGPDRHSSTSPPGDRRASAPYRCRTHSGLAAERHAAATDRRIVRTNASAPSCQKFLCARVDDDGFETTGLGGGDRGAERRQPEVAPAVVVLIWRRAIGGFFDEAVG